MPEVQISFSSELKDQQNPGIDAAKAFIDALRESIDHPQPYDGPRQASGDAKLLHVGWHEHTEAEQNFRSASKVEGYVSSFIYGPGKMNYDVLIRFFDQEGKRMPHQITAMFNQEGKYAGSGKGYRNEDYGPIEE